MIDKKTLKRTIKLGFVIGLVIVFIYLANTGNEPSIFKTFLIYVASVASLLIAYGIVVLIANWKVGNKSFVGFLSEIYKNINNAFR